MAFAPLSALREGRSWLVMVVMLAAAWLGLGNANAQDVQAVPALSAHVVDGTLSLGSQQRDALEQRLATLERDTGTQMVVLVVAETAPEDIASYAQRVADSWKIGRRTVGDGVLIVLSMRDRRVRIEVAKALEGAIPDLEAKRIINQEMVPSFKQGDYGSGLLKAADRISALVKREALPAPDLRQSGGGVDPGDEAPPWWMLLVAIPIVSKVFQGLFGRALGTLGTAAAAGGLVWWITQSLLLAAGAGIVTLVVAAVLGVSSLFAGRGMGSTRSGRGGHVILNDGGWGGGGGGPFGSGGGGGGGGGFSSGGGGDFGGGGASGSW